MANEVPHCNCRECGQPLDTFAQFGYTYGTCRTDGCNRKGVTLDIETLAGLTAEQVESYRVNRTTG